MEDMKLRDAICDLRFLLNRGYNRKSAINFVANHYGLPAAKRNFLMRAVYSATESKLHKRKLIGLKAVLGEDVLVDGYNVLITVESALKNKELLYCDDGWVRDTAAVFGKHRITGITLTALDKILEVLIANRLREVTFLFDSQVSRSGELCRALREKIAEKRLGWEAYTTSKADHLLKQKKIIATSDSAVIEKAEKVIDLPRRIAESICEIKKLPPCEESPGKV